MFHEATQRMHDAVVSEFGDRTDRERHGPGASRGEIMLPYNQTVTTGLDIGVVEFESHLQGPEGIVEA